MKVMRNLLTGILLLMLTVSVWAAGSQEDAGDGQYTIGFNNMFTDVEFFQMVEEGLKVAADENGINLLIGYGERDAQKMTSNIDSFLIQGADLIMDFNVMEEVGSVITKDLKEENVPMIGIDGKYEGAYFFGVNNVKVGRTAGEFAANVIKDRWNGELDYVVHLYSEPAGPYVKKRNSGASDVILETFPDFSEENVIWIDGGSHMDPIQGRGDMADFLTAHPDADHIYVQCLTDGPAQGALLAVEDAGREDDVIIISCDANTIALDNLRKAGENSWLGSVAAFPEKYGENLIAYALEILDGTNPPMERFTPNVVINKNNINEYYPE